MMFAVCFCVLAATGLQESPRLVLPTAMPSFALVQCSQDGKSIEVTEGTGPRIVAYQIRIPTREARVDKDGNYAPAVIQTETRTRVVPREMRADTYTVDVPHRVTIAGPDGRPKVITRTVKETRTRMVPVRLQPKIHLLKDCVFSGLDGKPAGDEVIRARLKQKTPVLLVRKGQKLSPFYKAVLNPELLLLVQPMKVTKQPAEPDASG